MFIYTQVTGTLTMPNQLRLHNADHHRCERLRLFASLLGLILLLSVGCKRAEPTPADNQLVVFAAASLRVVFTDMF
jgi:hypothetical protein